MTLPKTLSDLPFDILYRIGFYYDRPERLAHWSQTQKSVRALTQCQHDSNLQSACQALYKAIHMTL